MREAVSDDLPRPDPGMAAAALAHADQRRAAAQEAVRARSGWTAHYLWAYGAASVAFVLAISLPGRPGASAASLVVIVLWEALVALFCVYRRRQAVIWRGFGRVQAWAFCVWTLLWAAASGIGFGWFPGDPGFWVPAAFVVSAPLFVGARVAAKR